MIVRLLLFASAREAAGRGHDEFELESDAALEQLLEAAVDRYGAGFARVLSSSRVWVNGDEPAPAPAAGASGAPGPIPLHETDEIAVLPPVSGGA